MSAIQTSYNPVQAIAYHGMIADMHTYDADTGIVETAAGIGFGLAVSRGTGVKGIVIGGAAFKGITIPDITLVHAVVDKYAQYDNAGVLVRGDIWLQVSETIALTDPVYYVPATGEILKTATANTAIATAKWIVPAAATGFACLRLGGLIG